MLGRVVMDPDAPFAGYRPDDKEPMCSEDDLIVTAPAAINSSSNIRKGENIEARLTVLLGFNSSKSSSKRYGIESKQKRVREVRQEEDVWNRIYAAHKTEIDAFLSKAP